MDTINILATADVHSPRYLSLYLKLLKETECRDIDLIIWAGDMVEKNSISSLECVYRETIDVCGNKPIVAVFGNEEYHEYEDEYIKRYRDIVWLRDDYRIFSIKDIKIGVIGTRGALDSPTYWQEKNKPWLKEYYRELPRKLLRIAFNIRDLTDYVILVSHYGVTYRNLRGEKPLIWRFLASKKMERIISPRAFDLVIHGHAHNSIVENVLVNNVPIYNVSLPAFKKLFVIKLVKRKGINNWDEDNYIEFYREVMVWP